MNQGKFPLQRLIQTKYNFKHKMDYDLWIVWLYHNMNQFIQSWNHSRNACSMNLTFPAAQMSTGVILVV